MTFPFRSTRDRFELVRLVTQAVEGHTSLHKLAIDYCRDYSYRNPSSEDVINHVGTTEAIATMLHNAPALRELSLSGCYMGSAGARHLADGLSSKTSVVERVDLSGNRLSDDEVGIFARVLLANQNLKSLDLHTNNIGDAGALELAVALRQNNTLDLLNLSWNEIGSNGASALTDALVANDALKHLSLQHGNVFNAWGRHKKVMQQVERLLALNRGGRRLLSATGESIPPLNYWPRILARSSNNADVLFYFLREIPHVLVAKAGSRERKRGYHDETTSTVYHA